MHDSRTWRQRTGVKTRSPPPTLLIYLYSKICCEDKHLLEILMDWNNQSPHFLVLTFVDLFLILQIGTLYW